MSAPTMDRVSIARSMSAGLVGLGVRGDGPVFWMIASTVLLALAEEPDRARSSDTAAGDRR